jgi:C4-dicarboxylate-specific signal transduction histidine kinase
LRAWLEQIYNLRERLIPKAAGQRGRASSFSVQDEIQLNLELYSSLLAKQKISIERKWPKDPLVVNMSRSNLGQIVCKPTGQQRLLAHPSPRRRQRWERLKFGITELKHGFRILFSDDGPGISPEDRERIFDAEFSRKPHGMGLGLFIARQVMEIYGKLIYRDDGPAGRCLF